MTDEFRALCAEILTLLDLYEDGERVDWDAWRARARALLAQPEPEAEGPTDETPWEIDDDDFLLFSPANAMAFEAQKRSRRGRPVTAPVPEPGEVAELVAELNRIAADAREAWQITDARALTRAAELLEQRHPASVPLIELPQGWHMLSDIKPEPGTVCDWVIMAPWGCDHGRGQWPDYNGVPPREFFDVPVGWPVYYKGFANADGVMVSDPKLTAWRMLSLPTSETIKD